VKQEDIDQWELENRDITCTAVIRLLDRHLMAEKPEVLLGNLVVDHNEEYFFTERRKKVVRFAARRLEELIDKRTSDFRARYQDQVTVWGIFAARKEHDLGHVLVDIEGAIRDIRDISDLDHKLMAFFDRLLDYVDRHDRLLQLLKRKLDREPQPVPANAFVSLVKDQLRKRWAGEEILGNTNGAHVLDSVAAQLALCSLLENAIEAAEAVGGLMSIRAHCDQTWIYLTVENDGPLSFTQVQVDQRTVPFMTDKRHHLGLGVPIAQLGARLAGGSLDCYAREPNGLKAVLRLPLCREVL
jgi:signal transduction histidine kinase